MRFRYKVLRLLSRLTIASGILLTLGTAGASDMGSFSPDQAIEYSLIGIAIMVMGMVVFCISNVCHKRYLKSVRDRKRRRMHRDEFIRNMTMLEV